MVATERIEKRFIPRAKPRISLSNVRGTMIVRGSERDDIQVTAIKYLEEGGDPAQTEIVIQQEGDYVIAKTRYLGDLDWAGLSGGRQVCAVDYDVQIPTGCALIARQIDGTVDVAAVTDDTAVRLVSGTVRLVGIGGPLQVSTVSATVKGHDWQGPVYVKTISGNIYITASCLSELRATTISGDVLVETSAETTGVYNIHSVSGDVHVSLPANQEMASCRADVSARKGSGVAHEIACRRHDRLAVFDGGGPRIRFLGSPDRLSLHRLAGKA